jgi:hypothetical protein
MTIRWTRLAEAILPWSEITSKILLPVVLAIATYVVQRELARLSAQTSAELKDAQIIEKFSEIKRDDQRLAAAFLQGISSADIKRRLRHLMIWEAFERSVPVERTATKEELQSIRDKLTDFNVRDWHLIGEIAYDLRYRHGADTARAEEEAASFKCWWTSDLRNHLIDSRWPQFHAELTTLFTWLENTYDLELAQIPSTKCAHH